MCACPNIFALVIISKYREENILTCSYAVLQSLATVSQNLVQSHVILADRKQVPEKLL